MAEASQPYEVGLKCPICLEIFTVPKVLTCLHTYCEKCLCNLIRSRKEEGIQLSSLECPICRVPTPIPNVNQIPDDWIANLPPNNIVKSLLDLDKTEKSDQIFCTPCSSEGREDRSLAYCVTCSEYLCHTCYQCHKRFKATKEHNITAKIVSDFPNPDECMRDMYICSLHGKKIKYYCEEHKTLCCNKEAIESHRTCRNLSCVEDLAKGVLESDEYKRVIKNLKLLKTQFTDLADNRYKNLNSTGQQKEDIAALIKEKTKNIKDLFDILEGSALKELDEIFKQVHIDVSDVIGECKSAMAALETSERTLLECTKRAERTQIFIVLTKISQQVQKCMQYFKSASSKSDEIKLEYRYNEELESIMKPIHSLGQLVKSSKKVQLSSVNERTQSNHRRVERKSMMKFDAKIDNEINCDIYSGTFLHDGKIVLADHGNWKIKLFNGDLQCKSHIELTKEPRHICCVDSQTVAVTVDTNVHLIQVRETLTQLRIINVGCSCHGIAVYQQQIYVDVYPNPDSLYVYDSKDSLMKRIKHFDKLPVPQNAHCVRSDGLIHYTKENEIVTIDMDGRRLCKFESENLKGMRGITVDPDDNIYCCCELSNIVVCVSKEGKQLLVLLSGTDGIEKPVGISISPENDKIMILENKNNIVKIYKLHDN